MSRDSGKRKTSRKGGRRGSRNTSNNRKNERRAFEREAVARSEERFTVSPTPMGFPKEKIANRKFGTDVFNVVSSILCKFKPCLLRTIILNDTKKEIKKRIAEGPTGQYSLIFLGG